MADPQALRLPTRLPQGGDAAGTAGNGLAHHVHELTRVAPGPMMVPMRRRRPRAIGLVMCATVLATLFCPCAMAVAAPAADAHGCCPVETGLRAAAPSCCAASTAPAPRMATPTTAGPAVPMPATFVLVSFTSANPMTVEAPQPCGLAGTPPLVLRI
jgi:hypothetical protein